MDTSEYALSYHPFDMHRESELTLNSQIHLAIYTHILTVEYSRESQAAPAQYEHRPRSEPSPATASTIGGAAPLVFLSALAGH